VDIQVDNKRVHAATGGKDFDANLPTVVFLHGAAMDHTAWALQSRYFAHHGRSVVALDLPGCGLSDGPVPDSVEATADWLMRVLDALGLEQADLVGHSLGALVALAAAGANPDRVGRLALCGIGLPMSVHEFFLGAADTNTPLAVALMNDWAHGRAAHIGGAKMPGIWTIGADTRLVERAGQGVLHACLKICNDYSTGIEAAAKVTAPTTILTGDRDQMTRPAAARELASTLPDCDMEVIRDCGHMMMVERPDEVLDGLRAALDR